MFTVLYCAKYGSLLDSCSRYCFVVFFGSLHGLRSYNYVVCFVVRRVQTNFHAIRIVVYLNAGRATRVVHVYLKLDRPYVEPAMVEAQRVFWISLTPPLHSTTSKVMVIVWRLRGNIVRTVLCCQCTTLSVGTVDRNSSYSPVGRRVCLLCFLGCMIYVYVHVCSVLSGTVESFTFMFCPGVTNLNKPLSRFCSLFITRG